MAEQSSTLTIHSNECSLVESASAAAATAVASNSNTNINNSTVRRKFEKFKCKLLELFFSSSSSNSSSSTTTTTTNSLPLQQSSSSSITPTKSSNKHQSTSPPVSPPPSMSNYYFGYTSRNFDTASTTSASVSSSSSADECASDVVPLSVDNNNNNTKNDETLLQPELKTNPFLDSVLTKKLITLNTPNLDLLRSQFEPYLCTIDDEDNFFDAQFMSAYISYMLVTRLRHQCNEIDVRQAGASTNLVNEIAREIFAQSESEPCGLKGCRINVILDSTSDNNNNTNDNNNNNNLLLDKFRFDSTCLLTTFELNLILKQSNSQPVVVDVNNNNSIRKNNKKQQQQILVNNSRNSNVPVNGAKSVVYVNEAEFHLYKCKLY